MTSHEWGERPNSFACTQHGKRAYSRRRDARRAARRHYDPGLREYPCSRFPGCWHIGHVPAPVKRGEITAAEWYRLPKREQARRWQAGT